MEQHTAAEHYAILIGVNAYPEGPLKGCVRDVQEIRRHLEKLPKSVDIRMFTASPRGESSSSQPAEDSGLWPTYGNVTASLQQITSSAKPGDFVYIHYSGHGTTILHSDESSTRSLGDLALVLLEVTDRTEIRYLRGLELAYLLRDMVEKRLTVTLVLDCCYSGSVVRKDSLARYLDYDPIVDAAYPPGPGPSLSAKTKADLPTYRAASMRPNWIINPDGYTILTACGPTEIAKEIVLNKNGQRHGALSYFLLRTFAKLGGVGGKQEHIYHHLRARFRESQRSRKNEQNPMFYGNKNLCFFGYANLENRLAPISLMKKPDGTIQLEAGQAHGISKGDQLAICPLSHATDDFAPNSSPLIATVTHVGALTSSMEIVDAPFVETGWMVTPLTCLSLRKFPIRLKLSLPHLNEWEAALQKRPSLDVYASDRTKPIFPFSFYVTMEGDDAYVIRDESQQIVHVPVAEQDQHRAACHVLDILEHLARFKLVRNLTNTTLVDPEHPFANSFTIQLIDKSGKSNGPGCLQEGWLHQGCYHPECVTEVKDGDPLALAVKHTGKREDNIYIHVYNADSCWAIENIFEGNHDVISSTRVVWKEEIAMSVPDEVKENGGQSYCEDVIKVFLTAQPTSFMSLELPELAVSVHRAKAIEQRGGGESLSDDWLALCFRIRIHVK